LKRADIYRAIALNSGGRPHVKLQTETPPTRHRVEGEGDRVAPRPGLRFLILLRDAADAKEPVIRGGLRSGEETTQSVVCPEMRAIPRRNWYGFRAKLVARFLDFGRKKAPPARVVGRKAGLLGGIHWLGRVAS
jgi:hypothetical protein